MKESSKIKSTKTDRIIEVIGWILLLGIWVLAIISFSDLPDTIPIHFNASGKADRFGEKTNIFILPIIGTILFIGMTFLIKNLHILKYPTATTDKDVYRQYSNTAQMIRILKLVIVLVFGLIVMKTLQNANGNADGLGAWFLPLTIGSFIVPIIYFLVKSIKVKSNK